VPFMESKGSLPCSQGPHKSEALCNISSNFLWWGVVSPSPNPQAGRPLLVGCLQLLIQYILSYTQYLEAVSSICNPKTHHAVVTGTHITWMFHVALIGHHLLVAVFFLLFVDSNFSSFNNSIQQVLEKLIVT